MARAPVNATLSKHGKLRALDGIRGIAVLIVMASHFERFLPAVGGLVAIKTLLTYGWVGVDLFFVLSGFLITGILMRTKAATNYFSGFYVRRVLRIFPIYYLTLVAVFVGASFLHSGASRVPPPDQRWLYFVFLTNWIAVWTRSWPPNVIGHFWSLGVEEQFYLVWPACVLACSRARLARVAVVLCIVALVVRIVWVVALGPNPGIVYSTVSRMDSLLIGALCAIAYLEREKLTRPLMRFGLIPLGAFFAGALVFRGSLAFEESVGFSLLALGFGLIVLGAATRDGTSGAAQAVLEHPSLTTVGRYSYGMYVYHVPILGICELVILPRVPGAVATSPAFAIGYVLFLGALTFTIAAASFEWFERPLLDLKRHFEPLVRA